VSSLLLGAASGCSMMTWDKQEKGEITLSWYCLKKSGESGQYCEKRRLRNGKPVDDVVYETMSIPDGKAPPPVLQPVNAALPKSPSSGEAIPWSRQSLTAVNRIEDPAAELSVENLGPELRKPKSTVDLWGKSAGGSSAQKTPAPGADKQPAVSESPSQSTTSAIVPVKKDEPPEQASVAKVTGYTVQLAAFPSLQQCETFMANSKYRQLSLSKKKILSKGEHWWIVTHGQFTSYEEAQRVSKQLSSQYAGINAWARSWSVIEKLESR